MWKVGIVGGGLSGLALALGCQKAGMQVVLFEASARLGGQIHSERVSVAAGSLVIEHGAEGFVANSAAAEALACSLGIETQLVTQTSNLSFYFDGTSIVELPPGEAARLLGFQVPKQELGRGIRSFSGGTGQLIDALVADASTGVELRTGQAVERLLPRGSGWELVVAGAPPCNVDAVVIATTARAAGALLEPIVGDPARQLTALPTLSSVNVSLAYPVSALPTLRGTGFVSSGANGFRACSYASLKLPGRAPGNVVLLRAFFRPEPNELLNLSDADWVDRAAQTLQQALKFSATPLLTRVARWPDALPVHSPELRDVVSRVEAALAGKQVFLVGSAFHGSGIDAALRSVDTQLAQLLAARPGMH
jgi:protoporphyrinogen/coproporphyrinogen III oxidase